MRMHAGKLRHLPRETCGLQEHVKREKQIMAECDCPFMVNLVTSFKDAGHLYMLMECVMGGELFTYLQSRPGPLKEDHARFYTASVVLGLEYMQERNLLWRRVLQRPSTLSCAAAEAGPSPVASLCKGVCLCT